jgi:HNH endonuclease
MKNLTPERLKELLAYNESTGNFTWRVKRKGRKLDGFAGSKTVMGYISIGIDGVDYFAHRLAWMYVHGAWPINHIDHINGIRSDNRIANLRDCTPSINMQNQRKAKSSSKTGLLGASPHHGKFIARITVNKKHLHLGLFVTAEEAHAAYIAAKEKFHVGWRAECLEAV